MPGLGCGFQGPLVGLGLLIGRGKRNVERGCEVCEVCEMGSFAIDLNSTTEYLTRLLYSQQFLRFLSIPFLLVAMHFIRTAGISEGEWE